MKICFISHTGSLGGAERVLLETVNAALAVGHQCHVIVPAEGDLSLALKKVKVEFSVVRIGGWVGWETSTTWEKTKAILKITAAIPPMMRTIHRLGPDCVYSNTLTVCTGAIAAKLLGLPHVWHLHEFPGPQSVVFHFGNRFSLGTIATLSSACIVVSQYLAHRCAPYIDGSKLKTIYPAMTLASVCSDKAQGRTREKPRFVCAIIGGLYPLKRQDEAILAVAHLCQQGVDIRLVIVGTGSLEYENHLRSIIQQNDLADNVVFLGQVSDVSQVLTASDVVLVCSRDETFGRASAEAMLAGTPVIAARSGATPEFVREGVTGLLYAPGDPKDLAARIFQLCEEPVFARQLALNANLWARSIFRRDRYANELSLVLSSLQQHSPEKPEVPGFADQKTNRTWCKPPAVQ